MKVRKKKFQSLKDYRYWFTPYLFIAPFYITFLVFLLWPAFFALFVSMTDWMGGQEFNFIGLKNYISVLTDEQFYLSIYNTFYLSIIGLLILIPTSLISATLLDIKWFKEKNLFRLLFFAPIATTPVAIALVFVGLYDTNYGVINHLLKIIGMQAIPWLGKAEWIKPAILVVVLWRSTGLYMIYFLAGLQTIPEELHEAAIMDGASPLRRFFTINLPILRPVIIFVMVVSTIDMLQLFDESVMLNKFTHSSGAFAGPSDSGLTMAFYLYRHGINYFKLGYGSAVGVIIFAIVFGLAIVQLKTLGFSKESD